MMESLTLATFTGTSDGNKRPVIIFQPQVCLVVPENKNYIQYTFVQPGYDEYE